MNKVKYQAFPILNVKAFTTKFGPVKQRKYGSSSQKVILAGIEVNTTKKLKSNELDFKTINKDSHEM